MTVGRLACLDRTQFSRQENAIAAISGKMHASSPKISSGSIGQAGKGMQDPLMKATAAHYRSQDAKLGLTETTYHVLHT